MPCQMDKIRVNVCEELPKGPEQLLQLDINNGLEVHRDEGEDGGGSADKKQNKTKKQNDGKSD